jgi:nitrite reductase (NO-forming)
MVIDDDGTTPHAMTFNGTISASAIVSHYLEVTLASLASNTMPHTIDFTRPPALRVAAI